MKEARRELKDDEDQRQKACQHPRLSPLARIAEHDERLAGMVLPDPVSLSPAGGVNLDSHAYFIAVRRYAVVSLVEMVGLEKLELDRDGETCVARRRKHADKNLARVDKASAIREVNLNLGRVVGALFCVAIAATLGGLRYGILLIIPSLLMESPVESLGSSSIGSTGPIIPRAICGPGIGLIVTMDNSPQSLKHRHKPNQ
jgi:hypothetical protein